MTPPLRIVLTGASGFLGRLLVQLLRRRHHVIALDRRTLADAEMAGHPSVEWHQLDLADHAAVSETFGAVQAGGGAQVVIHLAAYYDFTGEDHPEYQRTNVDATRLVLDASRALGIEHFVFASSVAACPFSSPGRPITEDTPPTGSHIYARTKRAGEEMLAAYADSFSPVIVRFAAMFSDWCEYPPLQVMLESWLSRRWDSRILAGRGASAIPYLHVRDAGFFMLHLLERRHQLEPAEVLLAGEDGALSHLELFRAATGYAFSTPSRPIHLPRPLCRPGIWLRDTVGRTIGDRPFERTWMADYVDRQLAVDCSRTRRRLGWAPTPRLGLVSRLPFLIEHRASSPLEWYRRNREAMDHLRLTPNFRIYRLMKKFESSLELALSAALSAREAVAASDSRPAISLEQRLWDHRLTLRHLITSVRTGETEPFLGYCTDLAERRVAQGVAADEVTAALRLLNTVTLDTLRGDPEGAELQRALRDHVSMAVEFGVDRVLEVYEDAAAFGTDGGGVT